MFRLILVTVCFLAAVFVLLPTTESDAPEVSARADTSVLSLASLRAGSREFLAEIDLSLRGSAPLPEGMMSEEEAVEVALARGAEIRAERASGRRGLAAVPGTFAVETAAPADVPDADAWRVTGTRVNLRAGPGTGHRVVGQAGLNDRLVPLSDTSGAWIEVRMPGGGTAFIYGDFLAPDDA